MKRSTISQSLQHWSSTVKLCPITRLLGQDKTRAIGLVPAKGYFFSASSLSSNPSPGFSGSRMNPS